MKKIVLALVSCGLCGCSDFEVVQCPPEMEPVIIVKNIEKIYPAYAVSYDANLKATVKVLQKAEIGVDAGLKTKIEMLRQQLDQESSRLEMQLKTAVLGFRQTPCDKKQRDRFWDLLEKLNQRGVELQKLGATLSPPAADPKKIEAVIDPFVTATSSQPLFMN